MRLICQLRPQEGMKVLDLGCGTGYLSNVLAEYVGLYRRKGGCSGS